MKVKLYKIIDNKLILMDFGVASKTDSYTAQGFIVLLVRGARG